jgi:hypothetical protein
MIRKPTEADQFRVGDPSFERQAHNLNVLGLNPIPATKQDAVLTVEDQKAAPGDGFLFIGNRQPVATALPMS